mgnify:CR=1 FL=1
MAEKDLSEKLLEDHGDVFADLINVLIFQGERLLKEEVLDFFRVFSRDRRFEECKPVILREAKKGAVNMCTVMDYAEKQGKIEGKIEGKREQALETAMEMIRAGEGPDKIRRYTKLSEEKIRELQKETR